MTVAELLGCRTLRPTVRWRSALARSVVTAVPSFKGNWLMATSILRLLPRGQRIVDVRLANQGDAIDLQLDLGDPTQFSAIKNPQLDLMTASLIHHVLAPGDTYIDVGTNFGYFVTIAARRVEAAGLVLGVEANPTAYMSLLATLRRHGLSNVIALHYAAADNPGRAANIVRPFYRQTSASYLDMGHTAGGSASVITTSIDYLAGKLSLSRVDLIKIDTEGAELVVLKGARAVLEEFRPPLIVEVSDLPGLSGYRIGELYDFLSALGFGRAYRIEDESERQALVGPLTQPEQGQILFWPDAA